MGLGFGILFTLSATLQMAQTYQVSADNLIEHGAAERAAARIGETRGTIPYKEKAVIIKLDDLGIEEEQVEPAFKPEERTVDPNKPKPIVENRSVLQLDKVTTSSIPDETDLTIEEPEVLKWEVFDKYGRPVNLD